MKRTNYSMVYVTKEREGYTLWNNEPHRSGMDRKGEWVDSHDRHPMLGDTMPLVEAQMYGGCYVGLKDEEATPAIIVPINLLADYSETTGTLMDNDMVSFKVGDNVLRVSTEMTTQLSKSSSSLFESVTKIRKAATEIPQIVGKVSAATNKFNELFAALDATVREFGALIADGGKMAKKKGGKKHDDVLDDAVVVDGAVDNEPINGKKLMQWADKHISDLMIQVTTVMKDCEDAIDKQMDKFGPIVDDVEGAINRAEELAMNVEKVCRDMRTKIQMRPAGEAIKALYQRISILNESLNAQVTRNLSLKSELIQLENQNTVLANEAVNLRMDMAEWMKKEMPDAYKKLFSFGYYLNDISKATKRNEDASKELRRAILAAQNTISEFHKHNKIEEKGLEDCKTQAQIMNDMLIQILAKVRREERAEILLDRDKVESAIKNAETVVAQKKAEKAAERANEQYHKKTDEALGTDDEQRQHTDASVEVHAEAIAGKSSNDVAEKPKRQYKKRDAKAKTEAIVALAQEETRQEKEGEV